MLNLRKLTDRFKRNEKGVKEVMADLIAADDSTAKKEYQRRKGSRGQEGKV